MAASTSRGDQYSVVVKEDGMVHGDIVTKRVGRRERRSVQRNAFQGEFALKYSYMLNTSDWLKCPQTALRSYNIRLTRERLS